MTQADIFKCGCFAVGELLPKQSGRMSGIRVFEIEAKPRLQTASIYSSLIKSLGQKPFHNTEQRARQIEHLFSLLDKEGQHIAIIFHKAHLLPFATVKYLKGLYEPGAGFSPHTSIILLGEMKKLEKKVNAWPEISRRAERITETGQLEPWPSI